MTLLPTPAASAMAIEPGRDSASARFQRLWRRYPSMTAIAALVIVLAVYWQVNHDLFSDFNLQTAFGTITPLALVALGQLLVVLIGGIDVSVAGIVSLGNVVFVQAVATQSPFVALVLALVVGLACGFANGAASAYLRLPAIVVTLATSFVYAALAVAVQDRPGGSVPLEVMDAVSVMVLPGVPAAALWLLGVSVALHLLLRRTTLGRAVYGIGSSRASVEAAGIRATAVHVIAFSLSGMLAAAGGVFLAASTGSGDPRFGTPYLLLSVTAVAVGGASFTGGAGTVTGTICGASVLGLIGSVLYFAQVTNAWQYVIGAVIIVGSVGLQQLIGRLGSRSVA
jgi:ribose transport system permease protein